MRPYSKLVCVGLAALSLTVPASAQAPLARSTSARLPASARAAAATVEAFHRALRAADMNGAAALLAKDALIYESGGVERSKTEYSSHHLPADAAFAKAVIRTVTRQSGDARGDLAWIATESRARGTYKGKAIDSASTETMVLRRDGATWRILHIHWSSGK